MDLPVIEQLWRYALAALPLALLVALVCRLLPCRPSTRHGLWLGLLAVLVIAPIIPAPAPEKLTAAGETIERTAMRVWDTVVPESTPVVRPTKTAALPVAGDQPAAPRKPAPKTEAPPAVRPITDEADVEPPTAPAPRDVRPPSADADLRPAAPAPPATVAVDSAHDTGPIASDVPTSPIARLVIPRESVPFASIHRSTHQPTPPPATDERLASRRHAAPTGTPPAIDAASSGEAALEPRTAGVPGVTTRREPLAQPARDWASLSLDLVDATQNLFAVIPPLPGAVWFGGGALLVLLAAFRLMLAGRLVRHSAPAPPGLTRLVDAAARDLELRGVPRCVMTSRRVSPMILCTRRPTLVFPQRLWRELDDTGRQAVVYHELAHLRRRDHWVCWFVAAATCLYWWHPVLWWIRRRLRDEADLSCDAWVVTLLPHARRAYATALLETKRLLSAPAPTDLAVGLGASSLRKKRFARRITMVMTKSTTPRTTLAGLALTGTMALAGWLVTPALACPPDKAEKAKAPNTQPSRTLVIRSSAPEAAAEPDGEGYRSTFEQFMRNRGDAPAAPTADDSVEDRIEHLESQIDELVGALERWSKDFEARLRRGDGPAMIENALETARSAYAEARGALAPSAPTADSIFELEAEGEPIVRAYYLSSGKLKDLTRLMARDDVPTLISSGDDAITVHGSAREHMIFSQFVQLIDPDNAGRNQFAGGGAWTTAPAAPAAPRARGLPGRLPSPPVPPTPPATLRYPGTAAVPAPPAAPRRIPGVGNLQALESQFAALENELDAAVTQLESQTAKAAAYEAHMDELEYTVDELADAIEHIRDRREDVDDDQARREMDQEIRDLQTKRRYMKREFDQAKRRVKTADRAVEIVEERVDELSDKLEELADRIAASAARREVKLPGEALR